jgi:hypothetical protein
MTLKTQLLLAALLLALGFYVGTTYGPEQQKTEIQEREVIKRDIVTVVREVKRPDGTVERSEVTTDKSKERKQVESTVLVSVKPAVPLNRLGVTAHTDNFRQADSYTLSYERRLAGPLWVGLNYNTKQVYGASLAWEF